jgi:hypothetical protein
MLRLIFDQFSWQRPAVRTKGFRWEGTGEDMRLAPCADATFQSYQPHPGIFRDFADLEPTPTAVLRFANRYGALRQNHALESFSFWQMGIYQMGLLVKLSDAVTAGDWTTIPQALQPFLDEASLATAAELRPLRQKQKRREEVTRNEWAHAAVLRLYLTIAPVARLRGKGCWNALTGNVELRLEGADLFDFMFLQLGGALLENRPFRQCLTCGKWSLLTPGVNRADRITCSGYCRLKLYRQRRAEAVALHQSGWAPGRIAKKIGADIVKVKHWISQAKA